MRTSGGFIAQCEECNLTEEFKTQLQRQRWVEKRHIGHTVWQWRKPKS
jgi:hypothetical protein